MVGNHKDHCRSVLSFGSCDCGAEEVKKIHDINGHSPICASLNGPYHCNCKAKYVGQHTNTLNVAAYDHNGGGHVTAGSHHHTINVPLIDPRESKCDCDQLNPMDFCGATKHSKTCKFHPDAPKDDDGVKQPSHYQLFDGVEAIEVIARSMSVEMFRGYCLGNILKYRLRAGKKSELATLEKDMAKATFYLELYTKHKGLCYDAE